MFNLKEFPLCVIPNGKKCIKTILTEPIGHWLWSY
jgi:hypothetical protein